MSVEDDTMMHLIAMLRAIHKGGPAPLAALDCWPHKRLVDGGWVKVSGQGCLGRYNLTDKAKRLLSVVGG